MTGAEILFFSKETLVLAQVAQKISQIFHDNKVSGGHFSNIINGIPAVIGNKMSDFIDDIDRLEAAFQKEGINLDMSSNDIDAEMNTWERFIYPGTLKDFNSKIYSIKNNITSIIENYVMISRCYQQGELVSSALKEILNARGLIDDYISTSIPVREALKRIRSYANDVRNSVSLSGSTSA